jgi:hypothetical protein
LYGAGEVVDNGRPPAGTGSIDMAEEQPGSAAFFLGKGARIDSVKITGNVAGRLSASYVVLLV